MHTAAAAVVLQQSGRDEKDYDLNRLKSVGVFILCGDMKKQIQLCYSQQHVYSSTDVLTSIYRICTTANSPAFLPSRNIALRYRRAYRMNRACYMSCCIPMPMQPDTAILRIFTNWYLWLLSHLTLWECNSVHILLLYIQSREPCTKYEILRSMKYTKVDHMCVCVLSSR